MRCLSLTQPWASLVAEGYKLIETRSWRTPYCGPLAIHAAKAFPVDARLYAVHNLPRTALTEAGYHLNMNWYRKRPGLAPLDHDLPLGAVIATARLVRCVPTEEIETSISRQEWGFGNYDEGRWAWVLADVVKLPEPTPARGALGLWQWTPNTEEQPCISVP